MMAYLPSVLITGRRLLKRARASVTFLGEHPSMGATITVAPRLNDSVTIGIKCSKARVSLRYTMLETFLTISHWETAGKNIRHILQLRLQLSPEVATTATKLELYLDCIALMIMMKMSSIFWG